MFNYDPEDGETVVAVEEAEEEMGQEADAEAEETEEAEEVTPSSEGASI